MEHAGCLSLPTHPLIPEVNLNATTTVTLLIYYFHFNLLQSYANIILKYIFKLFSSNNLKL